MDASHLIGQMLGLVYVVVGVGIFLDPPRYKKLISELQTNALLWYFGGAAALVAGYLIITFGPNVWEISFEGLITLIGWLALLKGVFLLVKPDVIVKSARYWSNNLQMASGITIVLGLLLGYYGFM